MKKLTSYLVIFTILICLIPCREVAALTPPKEYRTTPQNFAHWLTDGEWARKQPYFYSFGEDVYNQYRDAYWKKQGYIVVPRMKGQLFDEVCLGLRIVSVKYFYYDNWYMSVYPVEALRNEEYFSSNIAALVEKKDNCSVPSENTRQITGVNLDSPIVTESEYYKTKKLRLGDDSVVDCVEYMLHEEDTCGNRGGEYKLHFFKDGMYVEVSTNYSSDAKNPTSDLRNFTFEKIYLKAQLEHNKEENKVTKKNVILYATMHNPDNRKMSDINLYFYDKKARKYKLQYSKKVSTKNRAKKNLSIKLNVNFCLKKGRKQLKRKQAMKLKRKTKYKYIIRVKMSGGYLSTDKTSTNRKYYDVRGSFKLK